MSSNDDDNEVDDRDTPPGGEESASARRAAFPVVGIGASAGGLAALEEFFDNVPASAAIAYVVVTHQPPRHTSLLPELIGRHTSLPTIQAKDGMTIEPGCIYFAPPGELLEIEDSTLRTTRPRDDAIVRLTIDHFFRSLARQLQQCAIGIVLSGTGSDGTLGLEEIKGASGMVMAQEEESARYSGMPHSAISTSLVDYILPPRAMPAQLLAYIKGTFKDQPLELAARKDPGALQRIFLLLQRRTGHDFSSYKATTLQRRIGRRMNLHHLKRADEYADLLSREAGEVDILFKELLIGVTSFFRDPEAFDALGEALRERLKSKPSHADVRVWVPGCSTGEEAYSIAIALCEVMEELGRDFSCQIFATDLDGEAIDIARRAVYAENISADLTPARSKRFFVKENGGYRINKELREMVIFAQHNLIQDPPFTKLDLLSCRNLLIYLDSKVQRRLIPIFHYALKPGGILFLGSSESIGPFANLFEAIDKKHKIFRCQATDTPRLALQPTSFEFKAAGAAPVPLPVTGMSQAAAFERLLLEHVPPTVLVHERGDVVNIHGRTGLFLEPAPGPQSNINIFNMARAGLRLELAAVMRRAAAEGEAVNRGVKVKTNGDILLVDVRVKRIDEPVNLRGLFQISFEEPRPPEDPQPVTVESLSESRIMSLERELQYSKEIHQGTVEDLETANEELKSANEELQSTNEELETSKEEMQSLNEELQTVNAELENKVEELSRTSDDMKNLLNGTSIATLFLDCQLRIQRFTEPARQVIKLIPSDIGRPISDLVSNLRYENLVADAEEVLRTLVPKEVKVQGLTGSWFQMRILPYRTTENIIDGLVLTFVDITRLRELLTSRGQIADALEASTTSIYGQDLELRYQWSASPVFGIEPSELIGKRDDDFLAPDQAAKLTAIKRRVLDSGQVVNQSVSLEFDVSERTYDLHIGPLQDSDGQRVGIYCVMTMRTALRGTQSSRGKEET